MRYALHDDWNIVKWDNSSRDVYWEEPFIDFGWIRVIKNCIFKVENSPIRPAWGAGTVNGSKWRFENCRFESDNAYAISCHNNGSYTSMPTMEFISCDFVVPASEGRFGRLISLTIGANGINNIAIFKGCRHSENTKLALLEEHPTSTWGMGCLWKVKGYANKFTNEDCLINVTDGEDYTSNLELL